LLGSLPTGPLAELASVRRTPGSRKRSRPLQTARRLLAISARAKMSPSIAASFLHYSRLLGTRRARDAWYTPEHAVARSWSGILGRATRSTRCSAERRSESAVHRRRAARGRQNPRRRRAARVARANDAARSEAQGLGHHGAGR